MATRNPTSREKKIYEAITAGKRDMVDIYSNGVYHSVLRFDETEAKKTMRTITEGENP